MISASAASAWSRANSGVGSRKASSCGSKRAMRALSASANSTGDRRRASISRAISASVRKCSSVGSEVASSGMLVLPLHLLDGRPATFDRQYRPGDKAVFLVGEKKDRLGDLARFGPAADGVQIADRLRVIGVLEIA